MQILESSLQNKQSKTVCSPRKICAGFEKV